MKNKGLPLRKCVACNSMLPKDKLFRVIKIDGQVQLDLTYKAQTRGAYICKNKECILLAEKKKSFNRAFKGNIGTEVINQLLLELENDR